MKLDKIYSGKRSQVQCITDFCVVYSKYGKVMRRKRLRQQQAREKGTKERKEGQKGTDYFEAKEPTKGHFIHWTDSFLLKIAWESKVLTSSRLFIFSHNEPLISYITRSNRVHLLHFHDNYHGLTFYLSHRSSLLCIFCPILLYFALIHSVF